MPYVQAAEPQPLEAELGSGAPEVARIVPDVRRRLQSELGRPGDPQDDRWRLLQGVTTFVRGSQSC
jgi:hypothetical protein